MHQLAGGSGRALVHAVDPERRGWPRVPFVGLIEAYVLRVLRELNFTMPDIRRAADLVRREFDDRYALASRRSFGCLSTAEEYELPADVAENVLRQAA